MTRQVNEIKQFGGFNEAKSHESFLSFKQRLERYKNRYAQAEPKERLTHARDIIAITEQYLALVDENSHASICQMVPRSILCLPKSVILRSHLPVVQQLDLCLTLAGYKQATYAELILKEVVAAFQKQFTIPIKYHVFITTSITELYQTVLADGAEANRVNWNEKTLPAIIRQLPADLLLATDGSKLRRSLPIPEIWELCIMAERRNDQTSLKRIVSELTEAREKEFWTIALPKLTDKSQLLAMAPDKVRAQWLDQHYSWLNEIGEGCMTGGQRGPVYQWSPYDPLIRLEDNDRQLAKRWVPTEEDDEKHNAYQAQMLSARTAEIAARSFYQALRFTCRDIAITQLNGAGEDWKTHDLLLDDHIPIHYPT